MWCGRQPDGYPGWRPAGGGRGSTQRRFVSPVTLKVPGISAMQVDPGHLAGVASQADRGQVHHHATPVRTSTDLRTDQNAGDPDGHRELFAATGVCRVNCPEWATPDRAGHGILAVDFAH